MDIKRLVNIALCSALLVVIQVSINFIYNIELVTLLFIIFAINFKLSDTIIIVIVFSTIEWLIYGFHYWAIMYYIIFSLYVLITYIIKKHLNNDYKVAILNCLFGLIFGSLHSLIYLVVADYNTMIAFIINGLLFDLIHGFGNFVLAICLFESLNRFVSKYAQSLYKVNKY